MQDLIYRKITGFDREQVKISPIAFYRKTPKLQSDRFPLRFERVGLPKASQFSYDSGLPPYKGLLVIQSKNRGSEIAALFVLALLWGYNWVQMKIAVQYAPPFVFAGLRIVLGSASLLLSLALLRKPIAPKEIPGTMLTGLLQIAVECMALQPGHWQVEEPEKRQFWSISCRFGC